MRNKALQILLLGSVIVYGNDSIAMDGKENQQISNSKKVSFSVDDVITHALDLPKSYEMDYLKSEKGKKDIQDAIDLINGNKSPDFINWRWKNSSTDEGYNKSVIGIYVSTQYFAKLKEDAKTDPKAKEIYDKKVKEKQSEWKF